MADQLINSFPSGAVSDGSLGVFGDPNTGALSQTSYHALKDYFTAGITGTVNTGSLLPTASFNAFTSSINAQVTNVFASESNYTPTSSFNALSSSYVVDSASFNTKITTNSSSFNAFSGSVVTQLSLFTTYTGSESLKVTNTFASQSNYLLTSSYVPGGSGTISGSGIVAQIAVFNGSTSISSSGIYQTTSSTIAVAANNDQGFGFAVNTTAYFTSSATFSTLGRIDGVGGLRMYAYAGGAGIPVKFLNNGSGGNLLLTLNDNSAGGSTFSTTTNISGSLRLAPGGTAVAQLHFVSGSAPTSPATGDVWLDPTGSLKIQINGVTKTFTVS